MHTQSLKITKSLFSCISNYFRGCSCNKIPVLFIIIIAFIILTHLITVYNSYLYMVKEMMIMNAICKTISEGNLMIVHYTKKNIFDIIFLKNYGSTTH